MKTCCFVADVRHDFSIFRLMSCFFQINKDELINNDKKYMKIKSDQKLNYIKIQFKDFFLMMTLMVISDKNL